MSDVVGRIATIQATRKTTAKILADSLVDLNGRSEVDVRDAALRGLSAHAELYPTGWYDPPPGGVSMLWGTKPFIRLQYESLRDQKYWPNSEFHFDAEAVGSVYVSSVERRTNMIGDVGLTIYAGANESIKRHIRACHDAILAVAENTAVGQSFSDLYAHAMEYFRKKSLKISWMTTVHDPLQINLGHTVPGSYEDVNFGNTFEEIRETIGTKRVYINQAEPFKIPETCALTVEARLVDLEERLPNTLFHFIVTFSGGEKRILSNFDAIFCVVGMDYIL